jgi:hypothetical protein
MESVDYEINLIFQSHSNMKKLEVCTKTFLFEMKRYANLLQDI